MSNILGSLQDYINKILVKKLDYLLKWYSDLYKKYRFKLYKGRIMSFYIAVKVLFVCQTEKILVS